MKTMCPPGYHHNGFVATDALGQMMYGFNLTSCAQVHELPKSHFGHIVFMIAHIYYDHLASVRLENSVCRGSLMTTYICILNIRKVTIAKLAFGI